VFVFVLYVCCGKWLNILESPRVYCDLLFFFRVTTEQPDAPLPAPEVTTSKPSTPAAQEGEEEEGGGTAPAPSSTSTALVVVAAPPVPASLPSSQASLVKEGEDEHFDEEERECTRPVDVMRHRSKHTNKQTLNTTRE